MKTITAAGTLRDAPKIGESVYFSVTPSFRSTTPNLSAQKIFKGKGVVMNVTPSPIEAGSFLVEARVEIDGDLPPEASIYTITTWSPSGAR